VNENLQQYPILGQPVHLSSDYLGWLIDRLDRNIGTHVITMNSEMVMQANQTPPLASIIQKADLVVADGAGITMALRLNGIKQQRSAGIDLGAALLQAAGKQGSDCPVAFYGGKLAVLSKAVHFWQRKLPRLQIVIQHHGYIQDIEKEQLLAELQAQQPRIILVALGIPRQEVWISENRHICPRSIWLGVGGSFDVWSGTKARAPQLLQKLNLEWLFRLAQEPSRWQRILVLPQFVLLAVQEWWQKKEARSKLNE
jgi:N-acetylglucosaminyldiphosphoundecaprenol N-acetyl-beta-D-mannosaminyltransferase